MSFQEEIQALRSQPHCQNCGALNPVKISYSSESEDEGFTQCCHESVCRSTQDYLFGDGAVMVKACCWAVAEKTFKAQNIDIHQLNGIQRFPLGP
ncbi:MAG: hypothetical protein KC713_00875 [Candidatus Omnitrophica bacterium]|nr:hypothetical protein [Candidatus Omnitrophota bacterium]